MHQPHQTGGTDVNDKIMEALCHLLGKDRFDLWLAPLVGVAFVKDEVTFTASSEFFADRLRQKFLADLRLASRKVCGEQVRVRIAHLESCSLSAAGSGPRETRRATAADAGCDLGAGVNTKRTGSKPRAAGRPASAGRNAEPTRLSVFHHPRVAQGTVQEGNPAGDDQIVRRRAMSLKNFVVGPCNQMAATAAEMLLTKRSDATAVYFWGPPGTGKTHLLTAIRDGLRQQQRLVRVVQLTAEAFTNDFSMALRGSGLPSFRSRYRDIDALLIDDIQFFGGNKKATLRELQHTVDALLRTGKRCIFVSDRPAIEVEGLPPELAGRMCSGMLCNLQSHGQATRAGILQQFALASGFEMPGGLLQPLAEHSHGDGRVLSGLVQQIVILRQMLGRMPSWQEVLESAAGELMRAAKPIIGMDDIEQAVCQTFGLPSGALQSRHQNRSITQPRMLAMYLARQYTRAACSEIGDFFGNRKHSTVIAATKRVEAWLDDNDQDVNPQDRIRIRKAAAMIENVLRIG